MPFVRRPMLLLLPPMLYASILILWIAAVVSGERRPVEHLAPRQCGPRLTAPPASGSLLLTGLHIRRTDRCRTESALRPSSLQGDAFLLSLRGGGGAAAKAATAAKPKPLVKAARTAAARPSPSNRSKNGAAAASGRKKASMSASVFNLVNNVAGAFLE